jgi:uncharacterized membrane protein YfcA
MDGPSVQPRLFVRNLVALRYREVTMTVATSAVVATAVLLFPGTENVFTGIEEDLTPLTLLFLVGVATLAAVIKGTVGFGAAVVSTPIFATIIDPTMAVVVLTIMPWMTNMFQLGETQTGFGYVREEWPLVGLAGVGTVLGVYFLSVFRTGAVIPFLMGVLLVVYTGFEFATGFIKIERAHHPGALGVVGFLEGFLVAAANMGPQLPAYLHTFERDTERYVGGIAIVLTIVHTLRLVLMYPLGLLTPYRLWLGAVIATAGIGGLLFGTYLRRLEFDQAMFDRAVVALLFVIGLKLLYETVPGLFF